MKRTETEIFYHSAPLTTLIEVESANHKKVLLLCLLNNSIKLAHQMPMFIIPIPVSSTAFS